MDKERLEIILSNILGELYDKTFDCNAEEFISYLSTEIGLTYEEMGILSLKDRFPVEARKYVVKDIFKQYLE